MLSSFSRMLLKIITTLRIDTEMKVGQHIHLYNSAKDAEILNPFQAHSNMHSNVDIWKKYIEPILQLGEHPHSGSRGSF